MSNSGDTEDPAQQQSPGPYQNPMPPPSGQSGQAYGYPPPPGYPSYGHPYPYRSTNGMAVASLVLGILGFLLVTAILALIFGYVARSQIRARGSYGWGMATAGVVLGWVWLGLFALRLVLLAGAFSY